jgi:hypothetical protein
MLGCNKFIVVFISFFLTTSLLAQAPPSRGGSLAATVRIPTHGCSATVIWTSPGKSYLLGCGHGYQGKTKTKKMGFDIPVLTPGPKRPTSSRLIAVDYDADLSLVELDEGPLPFVAPVAPDNYQLGKNIVAAGYDEMAFPPKQVIVHIQSKGSKVWWTAERPIPGRSGGGLIDADSGCLIGVCEGYIPGGSGMYIQIDVIHKFLSTHWPNRLARPPPQQPQQILVPILPQRRTDIEIPREIRMKNVSGDQCWACALETAARYLKIERLYDLTQKYKRSANTDMVENILNTRHVKHKFTRPGCKDKTIFVESIAAGYPVAFGVRPRPGSDEGHMMLMVGIDEKKVRILANSTDTEVHEDPIWAWEKGWDGWAVVLYPDQETYPDGQNGIQRPLFNEKGSPLSRQDYNYQDVGPVIPDWQFPNYQRPQQQIIQYQPQQQPIRYVPRQQPICLPGGS